MKILKWTGIIFLILLLLMIILPFAFKDKIANKVKEEANKNLNAKVDFTDFSLSLLRGFPDFKLSLDNLSIVGIEDFKYDTLLAVQELQLNVNLMSVIKGDKYEINDIILDHPRILAKVLPDGKANWDITKPSEEKTPEAEESSPFKMTLKKFEIKQGNITYDDAQMVFRTILQGFDHSLKGDFTESHFTLQTLSNIERFTLAYGGIDYLSKVKTMIKADLDADMPNFKFTFKDNEIHLNELILGIDGFFAMPKEDMDMDLKFSAKKTEFKNILSLIPAVYSKEFASVKTSGKLALDGHVKGIYNEKKMPGFGARLLIEDAMFQYPSLPKAVKDIIVDLKVDNKTGDPDHTLINLKKFHMEMAGNPVDIRMNIATPVSDPNINGEIIGKVNLASVKDVVPLEKGDDFTGLITADVKLKGRVSALEKGQYENFQAQGQLSVLDMDYKSKDIPYGVKISKMYLNFNPKFVELSSFESKIGKSDIRASGRIDNVMQYALKDDLLKGTFNVSSNLIDLNEFMTTDTTAAASAQSEETSVVDVPGNIDFTMTAFINRLLYDNIEMSNVAGALRVKDKKVSMDDLKMNLLDGSMVVNGSYDSKNIKKPRIDFSLLVNDFDVQKTVKTFNTVEKLAPVSKSCTGKYSTTLSLDGNLDSKMEPDLASLSGYGKLKTDQVILSNFGPINKLADVTKLQKFKTIPLNDVNISFRFKNGKVEVDPFDVKVGNTLLTIKGTNGFDQTIDYTIAFQMPRSELGGAANTALSGVIAQANSKGANLSMSEKINFNANIGGTVTNPVIKTGLGDIGKNAKEEIKDKAKEEFGKKKKEVEDKARAEAERAKKEAEEKINAEKERLKKEAEEKAKAEAEKVKDDVKKEAGDKLKKIFGKPK